MLRVKLRSIVIAQILVLFVLSGCARLGVPEGWPAGVVSGDSLYIGTQDGDLRALDIESGEIVWTFEFLGDADTQAVYGTPAIKGDSLFIGAYDGFLYALTLTGEEMWEPREVGDGSPIVGSPVVVNGTVLVGSSDGNLYAFDASDGSQQWAFPTGDKVWSTPVALDGLAIFGSLDHNLYAVDVERGALVWRFTTEGGITGAVAHGSGKVYVGSFDSVFYAIDAKSGDEVWNFEGAGGWYWGAAVFKHDTVYAPSLDGTLYALDSESGDLIWSVATGGPILGSPAIVADRIAVSSQEGRIMLVRTSDGGDSRRCTIDQAMKASIIAHDGILYVSAGDHSIRALKVKSNGNPDEEWIHFSDRQDPVPLDWDRAC